MHLERSADGEKLAPIRRSLVLRQFRRLGNVPSAPDHDRVAALDSRALQVGVGDVARQDPESETSLVRPPLGAHRAAFAASERVELGRPLHGRIILGAMPETPEQFWERVHDSLQAPPVHEWDTWPFDGPVQPRPLAPPVEREKPRHGEGGVDCHACAAPDDAYVWTNESWRLRPLAKPGGLPVVVLLEPREHFSAPGDLPEALAAELGVLICRIERAVRSVEGVGLVHVLRYGEGGEHLHIWFMGRTARMEQLRSSFAAIWDDVLPPTPEDVWRENLDLVVTALGD